MCPPLRLIRLNKNEPVVLFFEEIDSYAKEVVAAHVLSPLRNKNTPSTYEELLACQTIAPAMFSSWFSPLSSEEAKKEIVTMQNLLANQIKLTATEENGEFTLKKEQASELTQSIALSAYIHLTPHKNPHMFNMILLRDISWEGTVPHSAFKAIPKKTLISAISDLQYRIEAAFACSQRYRGIVLPASSPMQSLTGESKEVDFERLCVTLV